MCGWRDGEHTNIFKAASVVSQGTQGSGAEEHTRGMAWVLGGKDVVSHLGCKACGAGGDWESWVWLWGGCRSQPWSCREALGTGREVPAAPGPADN